MKQVLLSIFFLCILTSIQAQDLYQLDSLRSIYIDFENPDWEMTLIDNWFAENGERELATLEMNGIVYDSVAIRYKGNSTFYWPNETNNPKKPLNIDMNDFIADQELLGFNKIKLANSFFDPTALRDVLGFQIYGNYMPSPEANWMKIYIEDEYIGLYANTEVINKQFLKKHFDYKKGALFKCDPSAQFGTNTEWQSADLAWYGADSTAYFGRYNLKTDHGWEELVNFMDILNNSPENLESVLNIDRVLWYLATSTVIANYDSYNGFYMHNYYLYLHENGLFQILPWDLSESFIGLLYEGSDVVSGNEVYEWDIFNEADPFNENRPLVDYVANHPTYRKQYLAHIRTIMEEVLDVPELLNTCQDMQAIVADAAAEDDNAFFRLGDSYFASNVTSENNALTIPIAGIIPAAEKRKTYLQNHAEVSLSPPVISEVNRSVSFPQAGDQVAISALIENGTSVDLMVSTNEYASHFEAIPMLDDGMHGDGIAGDGVYGAFVPYTDLGDAIKYYIRAQNNEAMMLDPQRAEYEFHQYIVGQTTSNSSIVMKSSALSLSPNPVSEKLIINLENNWTGDLQIRIVNMLGQVEYIQTIEKTSEEFQLELSTTELVHGAYKILISNGSQLAVSSFIKM